MAIALWIVQTLLGLLFVFGGGAKLWMTAEQMAGPVDLPLWFMRFIGVAELLGGLGLVLPGLTGIRPGLTPLAAAGLIIIMVGAVVISFIGDPVSALIPLTVLLLLAFVAYGRTRLAPHGRSAQPHTLRPAA